MTSWSPRKLNLDVAKAFLRCDATRNRQSNEAKQNLSAFKTSPIRKMDDIRQKGWIDLNLWYLLGQTPKLSQTDAFLHFYAKKFLKGDS